jgi:hypothetical protein
LEGDFDRPDKHHPGLGERAVVRPCWAWW